MTRSSLRQLERRKEDKLLAPSSTSAGHLIPALLFNLQIERQQKHCFPILSPIQQHRITKCPASVFRKNCQHGLLLRSEEHTSELQSHHDLVCRLLLEKKK